MCRPRPKPRVDFVRSCAFLLASAALSATIATAQDEQSIVRRDAVTPVGCEGVAGWLESRGHQDVAIGAEGARLILRYEDRTTRQPLLEAETVSRLLGERFPDCGPATVIARRHGIDLPAILAGEAFAAGSPGQVGSTDSHRPRRSAGPRIDLRLEAKPRYSPAYTGKPAIRTRLALVPEIRAWWPSGLHLVTQVAIPQWNNFPGEQYRYFDTPYLDLAVAGMKRPIGSNGLASVSVGLFNRNRYGLDAQAYWSLRGLPAVVGGRASWTGYWGYQDGTWGSSEWSMVTAFVDVTVFIPLYDLRFRGRAGTFTDMDLFRWRPGEYLEPAPGLALEVARRFGEVEVGFTGFANQGLVWPGLRLALPLAPRRGVAEGHVAAVIDSPMELPWDFGRVVRGSSTSVIEEERAEAFYTGFDLWKEMRFRSKWSLPALVRGR